MRTCRITECRETAVCVMRPWQPPFKNITARRTLRRWKGWIVRARGIGRHRLVSGLNHTAMYHGIIPPLVTPLDSAGTVDEDSVRRLILSVAPYASALMPTLSSGEGWALKEEQLFDMVTYTKR